MRRSKCEITTEEAWQVFDNSSYATLACVKADGTPYVVTLSIARQGSVLYFHCAQEGEKIDALRSHPEVCVSAVSYMENATDAFTTYYSSCILYGIAEEVKKETEKKEALRVICETYTPLMMETFDEAVNQALAITGIYKIHVTNITGKRKNKKIS